MSRLYIQLSAVSKSFQSLPIFDVVSLSINEGDRFALVGENGSGKTTLLKLLMGGLKPDSGRVTRAEDISIGYLPQEVTIEAETVRGYLEDDRFSELERRMAECLESQDRLEEWEQCHELYVHLGGYRRAPIEKVFLGLKIDNELLNCSVLALSSGQKVRVALAKVLIENPDLLLLDEPTNHLDDEMVIWLQDLLRDPQGATVVVSHDRKFINQVCNHLIEICNKTFVHHMHRPAPADLFRDGLQNIKVLLLDSQEVGEQA